MENSAETRVSETETSRCWLTVSFSFGFALLCLLLLEACKGKSEEPSKTTPAYTNLIFVPPANGQSTIQNDGQNSVTKLPGTFAADSPESALVQAYALDNQGQLDAALKQINLYIESHGTDKSAYSLRGDIYSKEKKWDKARTDYEAILQIDPANTLAKFNLAELLFQQKTYDAARAGFVPIESSAELGDLASYKIFLCDLFAGHEDQAKDELEVFNQARINPSYYFSNVAWCLVNNKPEEAKDWLNSALHIYSPQKISRYSFSLVELGYLPIKQAVTN